jgi:hypothetical protein
MNNIIDILNNSFGYVDFMNTYNEMIESGSVDTSRLSKPDRKEFYLRKNEIKSRLKKKWIAENPNEIIRITKELKLIYNVNQDDKFNYFLNELDKQVNFYERLKQLQ